MTNNKKSILFYKEWNELLKELSDKEYRQFFELIFNLDDNKSPIIDSPILRTIFNFISKKIIENNEKYQLIIERNRVNGANGGRPRNPEKPKKPTGLSGNPKNPEKPRETLNDNDNDRIMINEKEEEKDKDWDRIRLEEKERKDYTPKSPNPKERKPDGFSSQKLSKDFYTLSAEHQKLSFEKYSAIRKKDKSHEQILKWLNNFDDFWQHYTPIRNTRGECTGKGDKISSRIKYLRLLFAGESHDQIMEGLKNYLEFCKGANRVTLAVSTFLNQERWKEDCLEGIVDAEPLKTNQHAEPENNRIAKWFDEDAEENQESS